MISVEEANDIILKKLPEWNLGTPRVLADRDYPPFHRVMMDGIALLFDDYQKGIREFSVNGICAAGEPQKNFKNGCMEVMTGAPLPLGADLVIQYEHLEIKNGQAKIIKEVSRERFESVHLLGSDCRKGDVVLHEGMILNGPHVGIMTSMGAKANHKSPRVMIISTGDELVEQDPLPHQIRRSNAHALKTSLELNGFTDITLSHLNDDPMAVAHHYETHAPLFDVMLYSGGVSMGKFDYLPNVWSDLGVSRYFHGVSQRPGKPLWFGVDHNRETVVMGLPGNPVSSLVCLHRYFLKKVAIPVKLGEGISFKKDLTYFVPVKLNFTQGEIWAMPLQIKNSGEFTALMGSDGFVELPKDLSEFKQGEIYSFYSWRGFPC